MNIKLFFQEGQFLFCYSMKNSCMKADQILLYLNLLINTYNQRDFNENNNKCDFSTYFFEMTLILIIIICDDLKRTAILLEIDININH